MEINYWQLKMIILISSFGLGLREGKKKSSYKSYCHLSEPVWIVWIYKKKSVYNIQIVIILVVMSN